MGPKQFYVTNDHGATTPRGRKVEEYLQLSKALPGVLRDDAGEASEVVEREVRAGDGVGALGGRDSTNSTERRDVDPRIVVPAACQSVL